MDFVLLRIRPVHPSRRSVSTILLARIPDPHLPRVFGMVRRKVVVVDHVFIAHLVELQLVEAAEELGGRDIELAVGQPSQLAVAPKEKQDTYGMPIHCRLSLPKLTRYRFSLRLCTGSVQRSGLKVSGSGKTVELRCIIHEDMPTTVCRVSRHSVTGARMYVPLAAARIP